MEQNVGRLVLLTGATGYVGGRLLSRLEQRGVRAVELLTIGDLVTVDGHLGIVTVGPPEVDLELA